MTLKIILAIILCLPLIFINKFWIKNNKKHYNIYIILLFVCINFSFRTNYRQYLIEEEQILYVPMILIILVLLFISTFRLKKITLDNVLIFIILLDFCISFFTKDINNGVKFWYMFFMYVCILLIGITYKNIEGYNYGKIMYAFNYVAIYNGILGILQYITNKKLLIGNFNSDIYYIQANGEYVKRIVGMASTNNAAGNLGALLFAVVFSNYIINKDKTSLIAVISTGIFTILTLTRLGYLAIAIEFTIYFLYSKWNSFHSFIKKIIIIILFVCVVAMMVFLFGEKMYYILFEARGNTQGARLYQFNWVFSNIIDKNIFWSGIGSGQYKYYAYYILGRKDIDIHSQYINILVENGWIVCFIFLIFNIYICRVAIKKCNDKLQKSFVIALFIGNFICMNYNPNQDYVINNIIYYLLMYCFVYKRKSDIELE